MSIVNSIRSQLAPIHPQGYPFIGGFALASLILFWLWTPLGWIGTLATAWCAYFFRDPVRVTPMREGLVVAPADGRVSRVVERGAAAGTGPRRAAAAAHFDLHERVRLPREPQPGRPGGSSGWSIAPENSSTPTSTRRARTTSATPSSSPTARGAHRRGADRGAGGAADRAASCGRARRSRAGDRIGMIRFGSRVDVYLPEGGRALVAEGQTAIAGETVLADLAATDAGRDYRVG